MLVALKTDHRGECNAGSEQHGDDAKAEGAVRSTKRIPGKAEPASHCRIDGNHEVRCDCLAEVKPLQPGTGQTESHSRQKNAIQGPQCPLKRCHIYRS